MCTAVEETNIGDPRSYEHYWTSGWNKAWKKKQKLSVTSLDRLCMLLESSDYFYRVDPVKNEASMKIKSIFVIIYEITRDLGILLWKARWVVDIVID